MTMADFKCDVCNVGDAIGVASTMMPYSCAYCKECAERNAQPLIVFECYYEDFGTKFELLHEGMVDAMVCFVDGAYVSYRDWATKKAAKSAETAALPRGG